MNPLSRRKSLLASSIALALGAPGVQAALVTDLYGPANWSTDSANFTMLTPGGNTMGLDGGANNVNMVWDGNGYNASSDYTGPGGPSNVTAATTDLFFSATWTAHDVQVFVPGTYSFDVTLQTLASPNGANGEIGTLNVTVPIGQLGMHMLFDWSGNLNIDMFVVANPSSVFGPGIGRSTTSTGSGGNNCDNTGTANIKNCLFDGKPTGSAGKPLGSQVWMLASVDGDGDGIMGIPMAPGGPFAGFSANFNANLTSLVCDGDCPPPPPVPLPAAVWLFGSGLLGLIGIAHRKKKTT
jgi:hypothetical protein